MVVSAVQEAKRAFVKKLLACAVACGVAVQVNRDASDPEVRAAYAQVQCQLGRVQARELRKAKVAWEKALAPKAPVGRPSAPLSQQLFRVQAALVMLTYHGIQSLQHWSVFLAFVQKNLLTWTAKHWCATLEACESGNWHVHLVLQFHKAFDRCSSAFVFQGIAPNVTCNDYLGEGVSGRNAKQSMDRAFFYVFADKIGTVRDANGQVCTAGNYAPCWVAGAFKYRVLGKWPTTLWQERKLDNDTCERYIFLCRDGVQSRKRNLDICRDKEEQEQQRLEIEIVKKRIRGNKDLYKPFPKVPEVESWLQLLLLSVSR